MSSDLSCIIPEYVLFTPVVGKSMDLSFEAYSCGSSKKRKQFPLLNHSQTCCHCLLFFLVRSACKMAHKLEPYFDLDIDRVRALSMVYFFVLSC